MTAAKKDSPKAGAHTLVIFSLTLLLSAALMFGLQPMIGKMLLPIVGGTPSGWIVAMAFFQVMLLAGYFLAHALSRFDARMQAMLYILALGIGIFFLPSNLAAHADVAGDSPMAPDVFLLLSAVVAVPFIALSATASTIQRLFTTTGHSSAADPYFLYAASNLGSFAGLLLYPFLIEPRFTLTQQAEGWLGGYVLLIAMAALCLLLSGKKEVKAKAKAEKKASKPVSWNTRLEWIVLALLPSGLLLGVTTLITTDIISVPLLWVVPLSLYLLTFVIAFSKKPLIPYSWALIIQPIAAAASIAAIYFTTEDMAISTRALLLHLIAFTAIALMCHMRLARARPVDDDSRHLTEFYLMIAIGGALGGVLNAFIAPLVFDRLVEYPIMILASALLNENIRKEFTTRHVQAFLLGCTLTVLLALLRKHGMISDLQQNIMVIVMFILLTLHPRYFMIVGSVLYVFIFLYTLLHPPLLTARNFYGMIKVYEKMVNIAPGIEGKVRYMQHGTTLHGMQVMHETFEKTPTTYYTEGGPLGDIIKLQNPKTVASVGLGTGTTNCYSTPEREITFFDIDPNVVTIAKEHFTFLSKCGTGMPRIILGDARLVLKKLEDEKFDLIILDAFSSDNIPTHLLTVEAIQVYMQRLNPKGIILFHISNRHFTLDGPIAAAGQLLGLQNAIVLQSVTNHPYATTSRWMALAPPDVDLVPLSGTKWVRATAGKDFKPWTDDYTNLLSTLNF